MLDFIEKLMNKMSGKVGARDNGAFDNGSQHNSKTKASSPGREGSTPGPDRDIGMQQAEVTTPGPDAEPVTALNREATPPNADGTPKHKATQKTDPPSRKSSKPRPGASFFGKRKGSSKTGAANLKAQASPKASESTVAERNENMGEAPNPITSDVAGREEEPVFTTQPHPAKSNNPADLQQPPTGRRSFVQGNEAMLAPGPLIPTGDLAESIQRVPVSTREELSQRIKELNSETGGPGEAAGASLEHKNT